MPSRANLVQPNKGNKKTYYLRDGVGDKDVVMLDKQVGKSIVCYECDGPHR